LNEFFWKSHNEYDYPPGQKGVDMAIETFQVFAARTYNRPCHEVLGQTKYPDSMVELAQMAFYGVAMAKNTGWNYGEGVRRHRLIPSNAEDTLESVRLAWEICQKKPYFTMEEIYKFARF
jgi:hypothetical protein